MFLLPFPENRVKTEAFLSREEQGERAWQKRENQESGGEAFSGEGGNGLKLWHRLDKDRFGFRFRSDFLKVTLKQSLPSGNNDGNHPSAFICVVPLPKTRNKCC
ncbi:hypothetical protein EFB08_15550 [Rufibacter latericius]|uniref:Uncharacterized protein n=1 Tax=Rufibacter latericius TaxID=2487040 RepID=A0A3M9MMY4_9BACT|nr:hypothetical protein EFB08_15550 [Rufibacter latericius]